MRKFLFLLMLIISVNINNIHGQELTDSQDIIYTDKRDNKVDNILTTTEIKNEMNIENLQKWPKSKLTEWIISHLYWCSWTWLNVGNFYSVYTIPNIYIDNQLVLISLDRVELNIGLAQVLEKQQLILNGGFNKILEKYLVYEEYWVEEKDNGLKVLRIKGD